jgi:hypothetical protein
MRLKTRLLCDGNTRSKVNRPRQRNGNGNVDNPTSSCQEENGPVKKNEQLSVTCKIGSILGRTCPWLLSRLFWFLIDESLTKITTGAECERLSQVDYVIKALHQRTPRIDRLAGG